MSTTHKKSDEPSRPAHIPDPDTPATSPSAAAVEYYRLYHLVATTDPPEIPMPVALMEAHIAFAEETGQELEVIGQWLRMIEAASE